MRDNLPAGQTPVHETVTVQAAEAKDAEEEAVSGLTVFESFESLQAKDSVAARCQSEAGGVELLLGASKKIYIMSDKKRVLPRHTLLGGYGTGK